MPGGPVNLWSSVTLQLNSPFFQGKDDVIEKRIHRSLTYMNYQGGVWLGLCDILYDYHIAAGEVHAICVSATSALILAFLRAFMIADLCRCPGSLPEERVLRGGLQHDLECTLH